MENKTQRLVHELRVRAGDIMEEEGKWSTKRLLADAADEIETLSKQVREENRRGNYIAFDKLVKDLYLLLGNSEIGEDTVSTKISVYDLCKLLDSQPRYRISACYDNQIAESQS